MSNPVHPGRLFNASCIALITTAMAFAIRGGIMSQLGGEFHLSAEELGWVAGTAFWGFALAMVFGGPLCDVVGMGRLLVIAWICHVIGIILTILSTGFWSLFISTLLVGLANGSVEAACNPLVATLFPDDKTTKLNLFHSCFPGGLVIGGLASYFLGKAGFGWQWQIATMLVPAAIYGFLFLGQSFPRTERVTSGVSTKDMFMECFRPLFLFMMACMCLTAATELGTNQFISFLLENSGVAGILVLVWVNFLMAIGRTVAGPVVHRLSPAGVLLGSSLLAVAGLYWLSLARGQMAFAAAAVFAMGICYFWPTMLGFVSERLPKSGAVGLAAMGRIGTLSSSAAFPVIGRLYDRGFDAAKSSGLDGAAAQLAAGSSVLRDMAVLPIILIVAFSFLAFHQRGKGATKLRAAQEQA